MKGPKAVQLHQLAAMSNSVSLEPLVLAPMTRIMHDVEGRIHQVSLQKWPDAGSDEDSLDQAAWQSRMVPGSISMTALHS